jgi:thioredoxin 1
MYKVIDFYADWCKPCKVMDPIIEELAKEMTDVRFEQVNVEEEPEYTSEMGVMSLPTFVVFQDDVEIYRTVGAQTKEKFRSELESKMK